MQDGSIWCATIGKFVNIAAAVRINATNHPTWRATLHHFTSRAASYWPDAEDEQGFFEWRRDNRVTILSDVAELADQIDVERAREAARRAEQQMQHEHDAEIDAALKRANVRLEAAGAH